MHASRRIASLAALIAALALPASVSAQPVPQPPRPGAATPGGPPAHGRHHRGGRFMHALRKLDLSAEQKQQIEGFVQQTKQANFNADPATKKANVAKLHQNILGVLTPQQKEQLETEIARERAAAPNVPPR